MSADVSVPCPLGPTLSRLVATGSDYRSGRDVLDHPFSHLGLLYAPGVSSQVLVGAAVTLIGVALGGVISLALNRQQMRDARAQRTEEAARQQHRVSVDRRFQAYSDFLMRARSYRNVVRDYCLPLDHKPTLAELDDLMRSANDSSALVFLSVEDKDTYDTGRMVLVALAQVNELAHQMNPAAAEDPWPRLRGLMGRALRNFQIAARKELGVGGVSDEWMSYKVIPDDKPGPRISDP
jgi:hypothetical protein